MTQNSAVKVTKLERRPDGSLGPEAKLGASSEEQQELQTAMNGLLRRMAERARHIFLLEWEGNKVPRGTVVDGKTIAWTQNGMVTSQSGDEIGVYERLVEFGGKTGRQQQMLVFVN